MSVKDTDLAWLAAMIEAEGSICMIVTGPTASQFSGRVVFVNTDGGIVAGATAVLAALGVKFNIHARKPSTNRFGKKQIMQITVANHAAVSTLIRCILPFMRSAKKQKAELIAQWCEKRIPKKNRGPNGSRAYSAEEVFLAEQIRSLN